MALYVAFGLLTAAWAGLLRFFRHHRIWLPYYAVGAVGLALLIVFAGTRLFPIEEGLKYATAYTGHMVCRLAGIPTYVFRAAPGDILVWLIVQEPGWTIVRVDLECSSLLEMATLAGLMLFYPAWTAGRRLALVGAGLAIIFAANIVRVVSIIAILHIFGKPAISIAHTIIGRLVFFGLIMALYWILFSRFTVRTLAGRLQTRVRA